MHVELGVVGVGMEVVVARRGVESVRLSVASRGWV